MPSLYEADRRRELVERLARLDATQHPRWGRFTAPQMLAHLLEAMRMASGELRLPLRPFPLRPLVRLMFIHVLPMPKGAPTAPAMLARKPDSWEVDVAAVRAAIEAVREPPAGATLPVHPLFGRMSARDWGVLMYKHIDHHFRQFAV